MNKTLLKTIRNILNEEIKTRDNDRLLHCNVWWYEIQKLFPTQAEAACQDFLRIYNDGHLTPPSTISRARRKLQEEDKTLRGESWYKRKGRAEEFKQEMIKFKYNI
tara:strand:- start:1077 stop:1394 length:318 start_codon:yes stop_codon:yes gene_type:complete